MTYSKYIYTAYIYNTAYQANELDVKTSENLAYGATELYRSLLKPQRIWHTLLYITSLIWKDTET